MQVGVKFVNDIRGEAYGGGIGRDGGQKGFEMRGNDLVEDGLVRIAWHIRGWGSLQIPGREHWDLGRRTSVGVLPRRGILKAMMI